MNETNPHAWKDPGVIWPDLYHPHVSQTKKLKSPMEQGLAQGEVVASPTRRLKPRYPFLQTQDGFLSKLYKGEGFRSRWGLLLMLSAMSEHMLCASLVLGVFIYLLA